MAERSGGSGKGSGTSSGSGSKSGGRGGATSKSGSQARSGGSAKKSAGSRARPRTQAPPPEKGLVSRISDIAESALSLATKSGATSFKLSRAILSKSPDSIRAMQEAGSYLKDLREVAGLTRAELSEALDMRDESVIEAVENGTATLSFELILRMAALLARHDPIPFIIRFTRTYRPELWKILDDWGVGRVPLQFERERHFINMYRSHDAARRLSDEGFDKVLKFTRGAFESALHFMAEAEGIKEEREKGKKKAAAGKSGKSKASGAAKKTGTSESDPESE